MTTTDPAAQSSYRVPRSQLDDFYEMGEPLPASRVGAGIVTSIDGDTLTLRVGDDLIDGVVFQGEPPEIGEGVEMESRGDLVVVPATHAIDTFLKGRENDAQHIVSDVDPGLPTSAVLNIGGAMTSLTSWEIYGNDLLAWVEELAVVGTGIRLAQTASAAARTWADMAATTWSALDPSVTWATVSAVDNDATLWSTLPFEVEPGDILEIETELALIAGSATAQIVLAYTAVEDSDMLPTDAATVLAYPPLVTLAGASTVVAATVEIPADVSGDQPRTAKIGIAIVGTVTADVVVMRTAATKLSKGWPVGSLWMDPDSESGGLVTAGSGASTTAGTAAPIGTANVYAKLPAIKKAIISAPPDCGGIVMVFASGSMITRAALASIRLRLASVSGLVQSSQTRVVETDVGEFTPWSLSGILPIGAGQSDEVAVEFAYTANPATASEVWAPTMQTVFLPHAVMAGSAPQDATIRWWDGDSWRPQSLKPAMLDLSVEGIVVPVGKTASSTAIATSVSIARSGQSVLLTATVSPSDATGSVNFSVSDTLTGAKTTIGSATVSGGVATKTWIAQSVSGATNLYLFADYLGDADYEVSGASSAMFTVQLKYALTRLTSPQFAQGYPEGGGQLTGTAVRQGYNASDGSGNRRSLLGFDLGVLPSGAVATSVRLHCTNWAHWQASNQQGQLIVGWHEQPTASPNWPSTKVHINQSQHTVGEGEWWVDLSSWANAVVLRADFEGLTLGAGISTAALYYGYSAASATALFKLEVIYEYWA